MLRRVNHKLLVHAVPLGSFCPADLAFFYPRFQPATHLPVASGLPEVTAAVSALQEGALGFNKAFPILSRCQDIFDNLGPHMDAVAAMHRPVVAARIQVAKSTPRPHFAQSSIANFDLWVVENTSRALSVSAEVWLRDDEQQFDTTCVLLAQFVESFCKLHTALSPEQSAQNIASDWTCEGWTLRKALALVEELLVISERLMRKPENSNVVKRKVNNLGWARVKLYLLKSLLLILTTGNVIRANEMVTQSITEVEMWTMKARTIFDPPMKGVPELGLLYQFQAEYRWRMFDWCTYPEETTDGLVVAAMSRGISYYHYSPDGTQQDLDSSVDAARVEDLDLLELDAYSTCLLSSANFFLSMPQPDAAKAAFTHRIRFSPSPLVTAMAGGTAAKTSEVQERQGLTLHNARKRALRCLERALKVNRKLFPDHPTNAKAGQILLSMACLYADMRDYLFSVGLFNKAGPCFLESYGPHSDEYMHFLELEAQCLKSLGSGKESESRYEKISAIKLRRGAGNN